MNRSIDEVARRFDALAEGYDRTQGPTLQRTHEKMVALLEPGVHDVILDIGCGTGSLLVALAPRVRRVIGIDISEAMLDQALQKASGFNNIAIGHGSFQTPDESFDIAKEGITKIAAGYALHFLDAQEQRVAIETLISIIPQEGRVVVGGLMAFEPPDPKRDHFDPGYEHVLPVKDLEAMFRLAGAVPTSHRISAIEGVIVAVHERS